MLPEFVREMAFPDSLSAGLVRSRVVKTSAVEPSLIVPSRTQSWKIPLNIVAARRSCFSSASAVAVTSAPQGGSRGSLAAPSTR